MNKYNSRVPRLFQPLPWEGEWAVTLGQTSYFTCSKSEVSPPWHKHEDKHKQQWADLGWKFPFWYIIYNFRYGYNQNPFEIEAELAELK